MENWPLSIYWEEIDCELWQWSNVESWLKEQLISYYSSIYINPFFILILCSLILPHNIIIIFFLTIIIWCYWFFILCCSHPKSCYRFIIFIRMLVVENIIILIIINIITNNGSIKHISALWELRLWLKDHFSKLYRQ